MKQKLNIQVKKFICIQFTLFEPNKLPRLSNSIHNGSFAKLNSTALIVNQ
jgi:hypothetical protein